MKIRMTNIDTSHPKFGKVEFFTEAVANSPITKRQGWIRQESEEEIVELPRTAFVAEFGKDVEVTDPQKLYVGEFENGKISRVREFEPLNPKPRKERAKKEGVKTTRTKKATK